MAGFIDNSGRRGSSLPDPQSINRHNTPIKKRVVKKSSPNKKKNNIRKLQSTVTANGGKRSQGIYNGRKIEDSTVSVPVRNNSKRLNNKTGTSTHNHSKDKAVGHVAPKNTTRKNTQQVDKNNKTKSEHSRKTTSNSQQKKEKNTKNSVPVNSSASIKEAEKINNFNKEKNNQKNKENKEKTSVAKHKKEGYWEKKKRLKKEKQEKKENEQKKREEQRERLKKNEENKQNLTISDVDKEVEKENKNKDFSHENTDSKETVIKTNKNKKKLKKKRKIFGKFVGVWSVLIIIAACVIGSWGHYEWTQASINKERDAAYQDGVNDSTDTPTVKSVLKIQEQDLSNLIASAPGASFPNNPVLERYTLNGWTIPGGNETHGRAEVSMCYTGEGITERKKASAYLVSDNANSEHPNWSVDSVMVTGDNCTVGESVK